MVVKALRENREGFRGGGTLLGVGLLLGYICLLHGEMLHGSESLSLIVKSDRLFASLAFTLSLSLRRQAEKTDAAKPSFWP